VRVAAITLVLITLASGALAQSIRPDATKDIEDCVKTAAGPSAAMSAAETCIGIVSTPCLKKAKSTADMNRCNDREKAVWDDILNETYRRLGKKLDAEQQGKLRDRHDGKSHGVRLCEPRNRASRAVSARIPL
jgi:hypothetical protein